MAYGNNKNSLLTRSTGEPEYNDNSSLTTEVPSFTVLSDTVLVEKLAHFNRERIPERVVHAKGAGAHGVFTVTHDVSKYTRASFLSQVGKTTEMFARFSTVGGEKGSADTARDPRGFALKFYTDEGNYDIVGNNTPIFFIRDAIKFPDFIHSQKRNPIVNLRDPDAVWDFFSLNPESIHMVTRLYSDLGTPKGFRHMDGFGTHTFMWYTDDKNYYYVKYHFITEQGIENFTNQQAVEIAGRDPDYATRDLYASILNNNFPSWRMFVQILTPQQAKEYRFDPFDVTKVIYVEDYPLIPVGVFTLNRLPDNFFSEVEQAAFTPGNFVPGIGPTPDKMLNSRIFAYPDTQRHRIGVNFNQLPINRPRIPVNNYQRDGAMAYENGGEPNYFPNSFGGPQPDPSLVPPALDTRGTVARHDIPLSDKDFEQADYLYLAFSDMEREHLISNILGDLSKAERRIQKRQTALFYKVNPQYGTAVADGLGLNINEVESLANMTQSERVKATAR